ncbi:Transmembrane protein FAM155B [Frankliniella fusca]|uniref:Transmembrane protein FAM155B n=1 Tax=Frankliniella fusca TaxID=407009 RepID=A0AAE1HKA0_9NEOP|nr:Transmembrane protein FAM155B [Frankliniella fusca]
MVFVQESYRRWVCSSLLPHFPRPGGPRVRPCRSVCRSVEQKCPFFLPGDRAPAYPTQYAGEPTFLCLGKLSPDPNIPESGEQLLKSSYGEEDCCYRHCSERGLPWLCPSDKSCLEKPPEKTPPPVVCEPPPPAPTPAPGERTLPSACAASIAAPPPPPPPRPSSGAPGAPTPSPYLLGLLGAVILHQLVVHAVRVDEDYDIGIVLFLLGSYAVKLDPSQGLLPVIPNVRLIQD